MCPSLFFCQRLLATQIVELYNLCPVVLQSLGNTNLFNTIISPMPVGIAKGRNTAVSTDTGTGKYYYYFLFTHKKYQL